MAPPKFTIPSEFESELQPIDSLDKRSDEEIIASITQYQPVTSEKNIWAFWHSGVQNMPPWTQRNIISMARINGPSWTIRILDTVPDSPTHALRYVPPSYLPETFTNQTMTGPYIGPHSSDFLRGATLYLHRGVYLGVGVNPIAPLDFICWDVLFSPSTPYNIAVPVMYTQTIANHFIAARKSDPFILRWHELFIHLWKGKTEYTGLIQNPLIANTLQNIDFEESKTANFHWDFKVPPAMILEYVTQVTSWTRCCMLEPPDDATGENAFNTSQYWLHNILTINVLPENWAAETVVGFKDNGIKILACLKTRLDADPTSQEYKDAYALVWRLLTKSSMQKVVHGKGLTHDVSLGYLLDQPENVDADHEEGTFAELLRYGAVHFRQTRSGPELYEAKPCKTIMKKGLYEP